MKRYFILLLPFIVSGCSPEILGVSVTDSEGILGIIFTIAVFGIVWTIKCWIEYLFNVRLEMKKKEFSDDFSLDK